MLARGTKLVRQDNGGISNVVVKRTSVPSFLTRS